MNRWPNGNGSRLAHVNVNVNVNLYIAHCRSGETNLDFKKLKERGRYFLNRQIMSSKQICQRRKTSKTTVGTETQLNGVSARK